jgi:hypothetical protein
MQDTCLQLGESWSGFFPKRNPRQVVAFIESLMLMMMMITTLLRSLIGVVAMNKWRLGVW